MVIILGFKRNQLGELVYYTIPSFEATGLVKHGFSTRLGGISSAPLDSLNLGIKKSDKKENLYKNYEIFCDALKIPIENLVFSDQIHEDHVLDVLYKNSKKNTLSQNYIKGIDALITKKKEIALVTFHADCVPLFFLDPIEKVVGLAHAGWKGTMKKIGQKTIKKMAENYNSKPENCLVGIGPSIGPCCFEVGEDVVEQVNNYFINPSQYYISKENGKYMVDLWKLNKNQLLEMGIQEKNITMSHLCTKCNNEVFFSHRGDRGNTGSLAAILQLI